MKVVVLVKQVPDVSQMEIDPATRRLRREGVRLEVSSFDVRALVKAVSLREGGATEVVALTMGPPQARDALVTCLALGADRAVHLVDPAFAGADTLATARALALAIRREAPDLVLCGRSSVDAETGQVGPEVAELLDWPQITGAASLEIDRKRKRLRARRETDEGFESVECFLPALVTATEDLAPEKLAKKAEREAAAKKPVEEISAAALAADVAIFGAAGSPTSVGEIEPLEERREGRVLEGEPTDAVAALVGILAERGLLDAPPPEGRGRPAPALRETTGAGGAIWVVAESLGESLRPVTFELLGKASELAEKAGVAVVAFLAGHGSLRHADVLARAADRVLVADDPLLEDYSTDAWSTVLARAIEAHAPRAVLAPSTVFGRDLLPRVAARLGLGLTGDCVDLTLDGDGRLLQWKPAFGGSIVAPIVSRTRPELATVRPGMLEPIRPREGSPAPVDELHLTDMPPIRTLVVERTPAPGLERAAALDDAAIAIGVGRGIGGPEALGEIEALAADLGGAALAATRDVTDEGWLPRQHQVGLTGRAISPRLYFAIGIRGAFEHLVGLRRAGTIVAINKNPKAPILKQADLGIVGDWAETVALLREALQGRKKR